MDLPRIARACGPRPPCDEWADVGANAPKPWKVAAHALNPHPHARDRHTGAFGSGDCTLRRMQPYTGAPARAPAATARPHARLDAAPKYMYQI